MSLLTKGFFHNNFFPASFWVTDFWLEYIYTLTVSAKEALEIIPRNRAFAIVERTRNFSVIEE